MKRSMDIILVVVTAPIWVMLMLVTGFMVATTLGWPIFFRQLRPGLGGRLFMLIKFRTMRNGAGSDTARLTRLGRFLRASSFDELPELLLVLRGTMSLVGPRPLLPEYLSRYNQQQARRHAVRPGITGWAQVNGRNAISWEEKFAYDVWYVEHQSVWLDVKILGLTLWRVLRCEGISAAQHETMPEFFGENK